MRWPSGFMKQKGRSGNAEAAAGHAKPYGFVELVRVSVLLLIVLQFHHKFSGAVLLHLFVFCLDDF